MNQSLEDLRAKLADRRGSITRLADESGISYSWLMQFTHGRITNPTVKRVEQLRAVLARLDAEHPAPDERDRAT